MEAKRKQKAWEREGKKDHTNFMEIQSPCVACIVPETSARRVLALADILKKGRRLGHKNLRRAGICVNGRLFSPSLRTTENKLQKCQSDLGFSKSKVLLQVGHSDAKEKVKAVFHKAVWILKVDIGDLGIPGLLDARTVTSRQGPTDP